MATNPAVSQCPFRGIRGFIAWSCQLHRPCTRCWDWGYNLIGGIIGSSKLPRQLLQQQLVSMVFLKQSSLSDNFNRRNCVYPQENGHGGCPLNIMKRMGYYNRCRSPFLIAGRILSALPSRLLMNNTLHQMVTTNPMIHSKYLA